MFYFALNKIKWTFYFAINIAMKCVQVGLRPSSWRGRGSIGKTDRSVERLTFCDVQSFVAESEKNLKQFGFFGDFQAGT